MSPAEKRVSEIRARLKAATPGPWRTVAILAEESELAIPHDANHTGPHICGERVEHVDLFREYVDVVVVPGQHRPELGQNVLTVDMSKPRQENVACLVHVNEDEPNVALIKHAPEDIRFLLELLVGGEAGEP